MSLITIKLKDGSEGHISHIESSVAENQCAWCGKVIKKGKSLYTTKGRRNCSIAHAKSLMNSRV